MQTAVQVGNNHTVWYSTSSKVLPNFTDPFITLQGPTAASQQMDDLFDVLIESGGKKYCRNSGGNW